MSPAARANDEAADTAPPVIQHLAISQVPAAGPVRIDFTVSDQSALFGVLFHWRHLGESSYRQIEFPDVNGHQFSAKFTVSREFEFWIEAYDEVGNGPAVDGTAEKPNVVRFGKAGTASTPSLPAPSTPAAPTKPDAGTLGSAAPDTSKAKVLEGVSEPDAPPTPVEPFFRPIAKGSFIADQTGRVAQARNLPAGRVQLALDAGLSTGTNFLYPETSLLGEHATLRAMVSPHELFNVGFTSQFSHTSLSSTLSNPSSGYPLSASVLNDFTLVGRFALRPIGAFRFAVLGGLEFPGRVTKTTGGIVVSPSLTALVTFEQPRFRVHLNAGYKWDNAQAGAFTKGASGNQVGGRDSAFSTFALGLSKFDALSFAVAAEVIVKQAVPYVGYAIDIPVDRLAMASCTSETGATCAPAGSALPAASWQVPQRLMLGVRYEISQLLAVNGGMELSLTRAGRSLDTDFAAAGKTATYLPLEGQVLPPPFLFHLGVAWQFGELPLPWVKPVSAVEPAPYVAAAATPVITPKAEEKPKAPLAPSGLDFEAPKSAPTQPDSTKASPTDQPGPQVTP